MTKMKRKMLWIGIPWMIGLFAAAFFPFSTRVCLLLVAFMLLGAFCLFRRIQVRQCIFLEAILLLGMVTVQFYTNAYYEPVIRHNTQNEHFYGYVTHIREYDENLAQYQLKGTFSDGTSAKVLVFTDDCDARLGDNISVDGAFRQIEDSWFWDSETFYRSQKIFLEAESDAIVHCIPTERWKLVRNLHDYREQISLRMQKFAGTEAGGLVSAMLFGTSETLDEETGDLLTRNGIRHVASVSGLHIVLILSVWNWVSNRFRFHRYFSFLGAACIVILYALMVDVPVSILRAGLMFLLTQSAPLFFRKGDTFNSLCFAGVVLTFFNPYLILNISFQLSMAGTFAVGVFAPWMVQHIPQHTFFWKMMRRLLYPICVFICISPVTICTFREVSLVSSFSNLLIVPICSLMVLLAIPIFLTGGVWFIAKPICILLRFLYWIVMCFSYGLQEICPWTFPSGWRFLPFLIFFLSGNVVIISILKKNPRITAIAIAISTGILSVSQFAYHIKINKDFRLAMLGKGSHLSVVITCDGQTDVIDLSGNSRCSEYVNAYLTENGIHTIDTLCLTKNAEQMYDTYGSALRFIDVHEIILPESTIIAEQANTPYDRWRLADRFSLDTNRYHVDWENEVLSISFDDLQICVGTVLRELPEGTWNVVFCSQWKGEQEALIPNYIVEVEEYAEFRVKPDGTAFLREE